jgi:hypothetical protein
MTILKKKGNLKKNLYLIKTFNWKKGEAVNN